MNHDIELAWTEEPTDPPVRFGVVGLGMIGRRHAAALAAQPQTELLAVLDASEELAAEIAEEHGAAVAASLPDLLARPDLDAVIIAVPTGLHAGMATAAIEAGKHVLVEKPIDVDVELARGVARLAATRGVTVSVSSQMRFSDTSLFVARLLAEGRLGTIATATVELPLWREQSYFDGAAWRGTRALDGGGVLMNQGVHLVDLLTWLLGDVTEVAAHVATRGHHSIEVEDQVTATALLASGASATIMASTCAYPGGRTRIAIYGSDGLVVVSDDEIIELHTREPVEPPQNQGPERLPRQLLDFARAVREREHQPLVQISEAIRAVEIIQAVYASAQQGQTVRLDTKGAAA